MIKRAFIIIILTAFLFSCDTLSLLAGFFYSYSTPDERFVESADMEYDSDPTPLKSLGPEYQFVVYSDIQGQDPYLPQLRDLIDNYLEPEDRFLLDLGDSTEHGYKEEYLSYRNVMDSIGIPWFQTIGNHDLYNEGWKHYKEILGKPTFTIEIGSRDNPGSGSMLIISIDSANSTLGGKQLKWLEGVLARESGHWDHLIAMSHSQFFADPILTVVQFSDTEEIYKLISLFEKYKVDIMFAAHTHVWNFRTLGSVQYVTTPPLEKPFSEDAFVRVFVNGSDIRWEKIVMPES